MGCCGLFFSIGLAASTWPRVWESFRRESSTAAIISSPTHDEPVSTLRAAHLSPRGRSCDTVTSDVSRRSGPSRYRRSGRIGVSRSFRAACPPRAIGETMALAKWHIPSLQWGYADGKKQTGRPSRWAQDADVDRRPTALGETRQVGEFLCQTKQKHISSATFYCLSLNM